jgi:hypothetical protein
MFEGEQLCGVCECNAKAKPMPEHGEWATYEIEEKVRGNTVKVRRVRMRKVHDG